jgi:hypothetical protein
LRSRVGGRKGRREGGREGKGERKEGREGRREGGRERREEGKEKGREGRKERDRGKEEGEHGSNLMDLTNMTELNGLGVQEGVWVSSHNKSNSRPLEQVELVMYCCSVWIGSGTRWVDHQMVSTKSART